jgi:cell division protein FtsB
MRFFILVIFVVSSQFLHAQKEIDSLLVVLEKTMANRNEYDLQKELHIKNLKDLLKDESLSLEQIYQINNNIINEYEAYSFDETLSYIEQNILIANNLKDQFFIDESLLNLAKLLASSGRDKESVDILNEINRARLSNKLLNNYYSNYKKVYLDLSFYSLAIENKEKYSNYYKAYTDSLFNRLDPSTEEYLAIVETKFRDNRQLLESLKINARRLAMTDMGTRTYSLATFERSLSYELGSNISEQKKYLILSAISDIKSAVKDNASLTALALLLFEENDIDRAHKYINFSFEDANFYNSRLRFILISNILPVITKAYQERSELQRAKLQNLLIIISILGIFLLFTVFYIFQQVKRLSKARNELLQANQQLNKLNQTLNNTNSKLEKLNDDLSESSLVKEHYIGTFLNIQSNYIDKLDAYRKMVKNHITAKKVADLFEKTKSNQLIDEELKLFYKNFDDTFLHIYPNFVEKLNDLLVEEGKIIPKNIGFLNTELRIFALIRLGITDSSKIAKLLRYSVNTIYNYRVKVKNFAVVPRDNFEEEVMKIGASKK